MIVDPLPLRRLTEPLDATVALPGSKSLTNRALLCAGLAGQVLALAYLANAIHTLAFRYESATDVP